MFLKKRKYSMQILDYFNIRSSYPVRFVIIPGKLTWLNPNELSLIYSKQKIKQNGLNFKFDQF